MDIAARNRTHYLNAKQAFNQRELEKCMSYYAPDHQIMSRPSPRGKQEMASFFEVTLQAWPDIKVTVEHTVADSVWVMGRSVTTATHTTGVFGIAPTQRRVETTFWDLHRFDDTGLIIETWNLLDSTTLMIQLGLIPAPK